MSGKKTDYYVTAQPLVLASLKTYQLNASKIQTMDDVRAIFAVLRPTFTMSEDAIAPILHLVDSDG